MPKFGITVLEQKPGVAAAEDGAVILDGPNGVAVAMTGEAAVETGRRLVAAGEEAMRQRGDAD
ncbi:MAG: hypothetical protein OSB00_12175 [Sphingomonas bacterium]|nr:hypothetical protein [Sphingomonas bacterium]